MIVKRTLRQAGYDAAEVDEAANGAEALQAIQAAPPDLILCDWNMPEMSGFELLLEIKKTGCTSKFGFITAESSAEMQVKAAEAGALFLISKPFTADSFQQRLDPVMKA